MWVCVPVWILYLYLPGNVKVSRSKEINISSFLTQYTTHELIVAAALKKKKKKTPTQNSAIQWTDLPYAPVCVPALMIEPASLTCNMLAYLQYLSLNIDILRHACTHTESHTIFPICFFPFFYYQK